MNLIAQLSPYEYYSKLMDLRVPGYQGYAGGQVSLTSYLSANSSFGGNSNAAILSQAMQRIVKNKPELSITQRPGFYRIFTGQGSRSDIIAAMSIVNQYQQEFKAERALAKYFTKTDFLQAMVDDKCFGLDCIGFVGTYLVEASLEANYVGRRPLDYAAVFRPVRSLSEITDLAVVMLTNGLHIQIIDTVNEVGNGYIKVDLCQSSAGGPQCNSNATIRSGGGDYLPVEQFRQALASKQYAAQHEQDNALRKSQGKPPRDYETYLRALLTTHNQAYGFWGGAIFQLVVDGEPRNPVGGSIYVGVAKGLSVRTPD